MRSHGSLVVYFLFRYRTRPSVLRVSLTYAHSFAGFHHPGRQIRKENKVCTPYGRCFGHAGIEETTETISSCRFLLHASSITSLEVYHPTTRRVYALTFLRYTYPRCGDR
jgi:hypothetical protein